jgi:hypothetical protein
MSYPFFFYFCSRNAGNIAMNKEILFIILLFFCSLLHAQGDTVAVYLNNGGMTFDSLEMTVNDPDLSYKKKTDIPYRYKTEPLKMIRADRIKSAGMLMPVTLLLVVASVLLWRWFYTVKKSTKRCLALIKAEKEEAELHLKIKEEEAVKAQSEKQKALSDCRLKDMELESRNRAIEQLLKEKEILNGQIEAYRQRINEYERINGEKQDSEDPLNKLVTEDIARLITKKLPDKKDYIESLGRMDERYISVLKNAYNGNLSIPYIKYCVCFAAGMEIGEVATCFSIEQASVHILRYRLKKRFGLDNNDDLDIFLRKINNTLSSAKNDNRI